MSFNTQRTDLRFRHVLARDLGKTVAQLEKEISTVELAYWKLLYQVEGEEQERALQQHGG